MNTPRLAGEAARRLAGADSPARARQPRAATVPRSGSLISALPGRKACVPSGTAGPARAVPVTTSPAFRQYRSRCATAGGGVGGGRLGRSGCV